MGDAKPGRCSEKSPYLTNCAHYELVVICPISHKYSTDTHNGASISDAFFRHAVFCPFPYHPSHRKKGGVRHEENLLSQRAVWSL